MQNRYWNFSKLHARFNAAWHDIHILDLPNELLDEIIRLVPWSKYPKLMRTCARFHCIVARLLYRNLVVNGRAARRCFSILSSESSVLKGYGDLVRYLNYDATLPGDVYLTFPILVGALLQLTGLTRLHLSVGSDTAEFLVYLMQRKDIIRESPCAFRAMDRGMRGGRMWSLLVLPKLEHIIVEGDLRLLRLVRNRTTIRHVEVINSLNYAGIAEMVDAIQGGGSMMLMIEKLTLRFQFVLMSELLSALWGLSFIFPMLRCLSFQSPFVNALVRIVLSFLLYHVNLPVGVLFCSLCRTSWRRDALHSQDYKNWWLTVMITMLLFFSAQ